ncbi:MAG: glycerol-3-phosphate dehydrogenase, partial [Proteobacteria bacterium]|nr:glycerol-3-phosphate dehydrogenase [Pseudomonadota bacterium]
DMIYAHCLGASVNPRITITSHRDKQGNIVWYMGGQLAEEGVGKSDVELVRAAQKELADLIPWLELKDAEWGVLEVDRAEIRKQGSTRPDSFSVEQNQHVITAWPTKMALSPALADTIVAMLEDEGVTKRADESLPEWQAAGYAEFPWDESTCWDRGKTS